MTATQTSSLEGLHNRYTKILETKEPTRTIRLRNLMDDMEQIYYIPALRNEAFEANNVRMMKLYRAVSQARNFD